MRMIVRKQKHGVSMKTFNYLAASLAGSVAFLALAAPASAQVVNPTFTGPRVEAIVGYDINKAGSSIDDDSNSNNDQSFEGVVYGGAIGYDFALGGVVVGAEAELTGSTADTDVQNGQLENAGLGNVDAGRDLYLGARVGFLAQPDLLVYAKGGYTNARYDVRVDSGDFELATNLKTDGYRLGAGIEYAMSPQSFAKIEYRYSNYSRAELNFGDQVTSDRFDIDLDRHQVVLGLGVRF